MFKKFLDLNDNLVLLIGIYLAIRLIFTKEIYMEVYGYTINTVEVLLAIILFTTIDKVLD